MKINDVSDERIIELLAKFKNVASVMRFLNINGHSNKKILELGRNAGILKSRGEKNHPVKEKTIENIAQVEKLKEFEAFNSYKKIDNYKVGDIISLGFNKWTVYAFNDTKRKIYHCINERGFRESFDALQLNKGYLTN